MREELPSEWPTKDETRLSYDRDIAIGWWMAVFLAVGTAVEYVLAVSISANLPIMIVLNVAEAAAIIWFFMHVYRQWRHGGHGRED